MAKDYGKLKDQRNSYLSKEKYLQSKFTQVSPMDFYRDIFSKGTLQSEKSSKDGLGCAIFRFCPDKSTYKKLKDRIRGDYQEEIFKDSDELTKRFAKLFDAVPVDDGELQRRYDELDQKFHAGKYLQAGKPIRLTYIDKKTGKEKEAKFDQRVHDDLSELGEAIGKRLAFMAPISYFGKRANGDNARYLYALVIDIDGVGIEQLKRLIHSTVDDDFYMCPPTYIVNSGHGVHLYYVLKEPVPCYKNLRKPITRLKNGIARMVWNDRTSTIKGHRDDQPWSQMYRVVGSLSKLGSGYPATAYRTGEPVDIMSFNDYIFDEYKIKPLDSYKPSGISGHDLEYWKEHNPDWYKRKILHQYETKEASRGQYPWLYEKLVPRVRLGAKVGNRYHSMCVLFADAAQGGIPYSQVYETCVAMVDFLNRDADEDNQFTIADVECAAKYYTTSFGHWFTLDRIEDMTGLKFEQPKRNYVKGQPQWWKKDGVRGNDSRALWMNVINADRRIGRIRKDTRFGAERGNKSGRSTKEQIVREYLQNNPTAKKAEVIKNTGLSKPTVYKYYNKIKEELL